MLFRYSFCLLSLFFLVSYSQLNAQCSTGRISRLGGSERTVKVCGNDGIADPITFELDYDITSSFALVLTDDDFNIIATSSSTTIDFEGAPAGRCYVFALSYEGNLQATPGENIYSIDLASACHELSDNRIRIERSAPDAGMATTRDGETTVNVCVDRNDDYFSFKATGQDDAERWVWLITNNDGEVVEVLYRNYFNFRYLGPGNWRVYGLSYDDDLLVEEGDPLFTTTLAASCHDLTDNYVTITSSEVAGGELLVDGVEQFSIDPGEPDQFEIIRTDGSPTDSVFVLVDEDLIIQEFFFTSAIDLRCYEPGKYLIWAYGYTGDLLAVVGDELFDLAADDFSTQCDEISENAIVIRKKSPINCPPSCTADAGILTPVADSVTLDQGTATIAADLTTLPTVPAGYESAFFLTQGADQTVQALRLDVANFSVTVAGDYVLHHLIGELNDSSSPDFFALSTIALGQTTIAELEDIISGQGVCADLTSPGAAIHVEAGVTFQCNAFAGGVFSNDSEVELQNGNATLSAMPDGNAIVPSGFEVTYLLTTGFTQTIQSFSGDPSFVVTAPGDYAIQVLIAETSDDSDPNYIDLSLLTLGQSTTIDLISIVFDNFLCGDLDFFGAPIRVTDPSNCTAFAGTTTAVVDTVLLFPGQTVTIQSTVDGNAVVPLNYDRTYLLTVGPNDVVVDFSARPTFTVDEENDYKIHAWVGEFSDPTSINYVNLNGINLGATPLSDLVDLINGAGLCSDIHIDGTAIRVEERIPVSRSVNFSAVSNYGVIELNQVTAAVEQEADVYLRSMAGQTMLAERVRLHAGNNRLALETAELPAGIYLLSLDIDGILTSKRVILR